MANIPLKSIKFPDLTDTYTVPSNAGELPYNKNATYPADTVGKALQNIGDSSAPAIIETVQGSIASFDDGADNVPVKDLVAEIVPLQSGSGDPSPDNVRAISGWSECNVNVVGKNLFADDLFYIGYNSQLWANGYNGKTVAETDSGFKITIDNGYGFGAYLGYFDSGVTLTVSFLNSGINAGQMFNIRKTATNQLSALSGLSATRLEQKGIVSGANSLTFTTDEKCHYWLGFYDGVSEAAHEQALTDVQLELGSTATTYEPYNGEVHTISFASAGTVYGGRLDVTSGVLTVDTGFIDLGQPQWYALSGFTDIFYTYDVTNVKPISNANLSNAICSAYKTVKGDRMGYEDKSICVGMNNASQIMVQDSAYSSPSDFKTGANGVKLAYPLTTPQTYQLTPTEVKTLLKSNNVWADTGDVTVEYVADTKTFIENLVNA